MDEPFRVHFQAGVDEGFLGDRVSQLDRTPGFLLGGRFQFRRGEGDAVDAIPAGLATDQDEDVLGPLDGVVYQILPLHNADATDVHQAVAHV